MAWTSARLGAGGIANAAAVTRPHVGIVCPIDTGSEIPFAAQTAPDLLLEFVARRAFICARPEEEGAGRETENSEVSSHPLRLRGGFGIARK